MKILLSIAFVFLVIFSATASGQTLDGSGGPCPRYAPGSQIPAPQDLFSTAGVLRVTLKYQSRTDAKGNVLYCFTTPEGFQSPTLHVSPGDELLVTLVNALPASTTPSFKHRNMKGMASMPQLAISQDALQTCGGMVMTDTSVNIHYHGTNTPPTCHQDEVIKTLVNAGETFEYDLHFPLNEPPGLYWYHPHIHGISEAAVQGGATGAIIVDGIENINPAVAGMATQTLVIRDNVVPADVDDNGNVPAWDLSLNYVPLAYPDYTPAVITMKPVEHQLWRVVNSSADTIVDLQVQYDGAVRNLGVVALDGVPTGSQDGDSRGRVVIMKHILLGPSARAEFILEGPAATVKQAMLLTLPVDTGAFGDNDPLRPLAVIKPPVVSGVTQGSVAPSAVAPAPLKLSAKVGAPAAQMRFTGLDKAVPVKQRKLYFSEVLSDPTDPASPTNFFITVDGQTPTLFDPDNPPAITTTQGSVEDWTIYNHTQETHEFHIHQIHFLVLSAPDTQVNGQYLDVITVPFWTGTGPYPAVKLRMDFRGPTVGDFVYHCHILGHEDNGMMAIIRVLPPTP